MRFTLYRVKTKDRESTDVSTVPLGNKVCGLRAHLITLDKKELAYILKNPEYGVELLTRMYDVTE